MTTEQAHHPLGASNAERWTMDACPGSVALNAKAPKGKTNFFAAEGTAAHEIAEMALLMHLGREMPEKYASYRSKINVAGYGEIEVDDGMFDGAKVWVQTIKDYQEKYDVPNFYVATESRVTIPTPVGDLFGTCDGRIYVPFQRLIVLDYKYGKGVKVDARDNKQLKYYALGSMLQLPVSEQSEISEVEICIVQPRVYGGGVHSVEISVSELWEFYEFIRDSASLAYSETAPLRAGSWCRWCPAGDAGMCHEIERFAVAQLKTAFNSVELRPALPDINFLSPASRAGMIMHKKLITEYLEAVAESTKEKAIADPAFRAAMKEQGYVLSQGRMGNRKWTDDTEVIKRVAPRLPKEVFTKTTVLTPTQMEEVFKKQNIDIKLDDLITQKPPGIALVQNGPKIKELLDVNDAFKNIGENQ